MTQSELTTKMKKVEVHIRVSVNFVEEVRTFFKESGRTAYSIAKEAKIDPSFLNGYMSNTIKKKRKIENMSLGTFSKLYPLIVAWKAEKTNNKKEN